MTYFSSTIEHGLSENNELTNYRMFRFEKMNNREFFTDLLRLTKLGLLLLTKKIFDTQYEYWVNYVDLIEKCIVKRQN